MAVCIQCQCVRRCLCLEIPMEWRRVINPRTQIPPTPWLIQLAATSAEVTLDCILSILGYTRVLLLLAFDKCPLVYVPNQSCSSRPRENISASWRLWSRPSQSRIYPSSQVVSTSPTLGRDHCPSPSISTADDDTESPRSRTLCTGIRATLAPS